jgi:hypothetical protein
MDEVITHLINANIQKRHVRYINEQDLTEYFTVQFNRHMPDNVKNDLDKYLYNNSDEHDENPANMITSLDNSLLYSYLMERHIHTLLSNFRTRISESKLRIHEMIDKKESRIGNQVAQYAVDTQRELNILPFIAGLPDDIIKYIATFAFTSTVKFELSKHRINISEALNKLKIPNLKAFKKILYKHSNQMYKMLRKKIPDNRINYMFDLHFLRYSKNATKKELMIKDIIDLLNGCNNILENLKNRTGYPMTIRYIEEKMRYMYNSIYYVTQDKFTKRRRISKIKLDAAPL